MTMNILSAVLALIGGTAIAVINARLSKRALKKDTNGALMVSVARSFLNILYLAAVFLIGRATGCEIVFPLIGAAIGLTVPSVIMAFSMANEIKRQSASKEESAKESDGE